jgi:hypothetical protein
MPIVQIASASMQSVWHTWKVDLICLDLGLLMKLMNVQSRLLLVFSLYGDADVHVFARCMVRNRAFNVYF